ncbi:ABC transporter permease [Arthrobacter sp. ATA002]|uniref:ABC transporter permease n=1 Tax=Arthrobacter sp. ATA002 TaxID=2991715 RepID=UPI0022A7FF6C|nr:ABC transporter permease [Arthrobacter sp. ATA002]WAP52904.1 ABC transporter permease [Arthrobacter sp. ATA002]
MAETKTPAHPGPTKVPVTIDLRSVSRVGARPSLIDYIVSLWNYRHFVLYDAKARVQSKNKRDRLGSAWLLLDPLLNGLGYFLIFGLLLNSSRGIENFLGYLIIGIFMFQMSSRSIVGTARIISANQNVIQAFNFPRAALALAVNIRELIANVPVLLMMLLLVLLIPPSEPISLLWFLLIPIVLLQVVFNLGIGLILAPLVAKVNDLLHLISFFMRFWLFASCVMFSIERYAQWPVIQKIVEINPLYIIISMARDAILYNQMPMWQHWAGLGAWALGAISVGTVIFWKGEESYGRDE